MGDVQHSSDVSQASAAAADDSAPTRKRILLIEDDARTRLVLWDKLRTAGFDVVHAANGFLALEKLKAAIPDAVCMDLLLPCIKGVEVIKSIRKIKECARLPIYVCTSAAMMATWTRRGTKAGASKVFDKGATPVDEIIAFITADVHRQPARPQPSKKSNDKPEPRETVPSIGNSKPKTQSPPNPQPVAEPSGKIISRMKLSLSKLGFGKKKEAPKSAGDAAKGRVTATQATVTAKSPDTTSSRKPAPPQTPPPAKTEPTASPARGGNASPVAPQLPMQDPFADAGGAGGGLPLQSVSPVNLNAVAVLTLDSFGKVVTADGASTSMFGWQSSELVGKHLQVLMKDDSAMVLGTLLQKAKPGDTSQLASVRIIARRKNGSEFRASVTRLTWSSDTTMTSRFGGSHWTAVFRDLASVPATEQPPPPLPASALPPQEERTTPPPRSTHGHTTFTPAFRTPVPPAPAPAPVMSGISPKEHEELRRQFESVSAEATKNRDALHQAENERMQLTQRVASQEIDLTRERAALEREITARKSLEEQFQELATQKSELDRRVSDLSKNKDELVATTGQVRADVDTAKATAERAQLAYERELSRARQFEGELTRLQQSYNELNATFASEQARANEYRLRADELASQLRDTTTEIEDVRAELDHHVAERQRVESDWQQQISSLTAKCRHFENAWQEEAQRNRDTDERVRLLGNSLRLEHTEHVNRLGQELSLLRQGRYELDARLATEQQAAADSKRRAEELEVRLRETATEVARVKSEQDAQAAERDRLESEWRNQLGTAETLATNLKLALEESAQRNKRFEEEVAGLRQVREELKTKLAAEEKAAADSKLRIVELERKLRDNGQELEHIKGELGKSDRTKQAEGELAKLYELRERLSNQLTAEQQITTTSAQQTEELEFKLRSNTAELNRLKVEHDRQAEEQTRLQSELRAQLETAQAAAREADSALKRKAQECARFEKQIGRMQKTRDELQSRLSSALNTATESEQRSVDLENELRQAAAELERIKAERDRQHARLENELQEKLKAALEAKETVESTSREQSERNRELERQLTRLREDREAMVVQLAAEKELGAEAKQRNKEAEGRIRSTVAELERLRAEREKDLTGRQAVEAKLNEQLASAKTAMEQARAALNEKSSVIDRLQRDSIKLREDKEAAAAQIASERELMAQAKKREEAAAIRIRDLTAELEKLKAERQDVSRGQHSVETKLQEQAVAAKAAVEQAESALAEKQTAVSRLERETANLREERQQLCDKFTAEKQAGTKAKRRIKELEKQLREIAKGFNTAKADLEKRAAGKGKATSALEAEIGTARESIAKAEQARDQQLARCKQLEEQLAEAAHARAEASARLKTAEGRVADFTQRIEQLEKRVRDSAAELARAKTAAEDQTTRRVRVESAEGALAEKSEELVKELCHLKENEAAHAAEVNELERRVREGVASLARATSDLENERGERRRVEQRLTALTSKLEGLHGELRQHLESERTTQDRVTQLEQAVREREQALIRMNSELRKQAADRELAEEQLKAVGDMSAQLRQYLSLFEESKKVFKKTQEQLESRLQASINAARENEARLQKEITERQRLEEALAAAQRNLHDQVEQTALDLARAQAELQVEQFERKRVEGDAQQSRFASIDSTRVARNLMNNFRRQIRQPVDSVMQSSRRLLEFELPKEQKKVVEALLEHALLLQSNLEESGGDNDLKAAA